MRELRPIGPRGLTPPPFLRKELSKTARRGWWAGLTRGSKLYTCFSALLVAALLTGIVVSSAIGDDSRERPARANFPRIGPLGIAGESVRAGASLLRLSVMSLRIKSLIAEFEKLAPLVGRKLSELSRVVQGGKCSGYLASVLQVSDGRAAVTFVPELVPDDPRGAWEYANALADRYLPIFKGLLARVTTLRACVSPSGEAPAGGPARLMFDCCNLQVKATGKYVRALEKVRDCDENTVGQACELAADAERALEAARASLDAAERSLGDRELSLREVAL